MLLELIARYYKFLWIGLIAVSVLKLLLTYSFNKNLEGFSGFVFALFKWYGEEEQELEDFGLRRTIMRLENIVTLGIYLMLLLIIVFYFVRVFLAR